jgi:transcriptional regulator with XRE-family HTH domain
MRLRQGRTEVQLARSADVERSHLSRIERNLLTPNLDTVLRILRGLGADSIFIQVPGTCTGEDHKLGQRCVRDQAQHVTNILLHLAGIVRSSIFAAT